MPAQLAAPSRGAQHCVDPGGAAPASAGPGLPPLPPASVPAPLAVVGQDRRWRLGSPDQSGVGDEAGEVTAAAPWGCRERDSPAGACPAWLPLTRALHLAGSCRHARLDPTPTRGLPGPHCSSGPHMAGVRVWGARATHHPLCVSAGDAPRALASLPMRNCSWRACGHGWLWAGGTGGAVRSRGTLGMQLPEARARVWGSGLPRAEQHGRGTGDLPGPA